MADIQEDYCILFYGYPLIKKFKPEIDMFEPTIFSILEQFSGMLFRINIEGGVAISVTPYLKEVDILLDMYFPPTEAEIVEFERQKIEYVKHKSLIENYIKYQLINSDFLPILPSIPLPPAGNIGEHAFNCCITISFVPRIASVIQTYFHQDNNIFQLLQYNKPRSDYVLGSELLFSNHDIITHDNLRNPRVILGDLTADIYEKTTAISTQLFSIEKLKPGLLRHKLNNGDTIVFADTMWKHAVINPNERRIRNDIVIDIDTSFGRMTQKIVSVCTERQITTGEDYVGRAVIGLFCHITDKYLEPIFCLEDFSLQDAAVKIPVKTVNFDDSGLIDFIRQIGNSEESCIRIQTSDEDILTILPRGGKTKKRKTKKRKNKKTRNEKTKNMQRKNKKK